jgi:hypothetical protein
VVDARGFLSVNEARRFLGWPEGASLPDESTSLAQARQVVARNRELMRRQSKLGQAGLLVSPIWELEGAKLHVRMAVLPNGFLGRYFEGEGHDALDDDALLELVVELLPAVLSDPVGAAFALGDVHRVWYDATAPRRAVVGLEGAHLRALSMLLADAARKLSAGLDELEWMSTLGLPVDELVDDLQRPVDAISDAARAKTQAMWSEEAAWVRAAFGVDRARDP